MDQPQPILSVRHLSTCFRTDQGVVTAVDDVSFELFAGESLGIVGESGCGKSVTSKSIMRLLPEHNSFLKPESRILFDNHDLARAGESEMRKIRGNRIAMIFQEPMTALNPVFTIGWQLDEALKYHTRLNRRQRRERTVEMLKLVEIPNPEKRIREFPHQLSGGMRQRVLIAIALCCEPEILIADEPTTALDVTIQAQILRLMDNLKRQLGTAIILITHDLGVIAQTCDRVIVMYAGQIVEQAPVRQLFHAPRHPYTRALLQSLPKTDPSQHGKRLPTIEGIVPSLFELPDGCRFEQRCPRSQEQCRDKQPDLLQTGSNEQGREIEKEQASTQDRAAHCVRCFFPCDEDD